MSELLLDEVHPQIRRLSRLEYDRMVELGMFERERLELIRGLLVKMSPQKREHASTVEWLQEVLAPLCSSYRVRSQLPFAASDDSEPEPDFAVAPREPRHEHPKEVLLLIEVAVSSLPLDRGDKRALYAQVGVPEYWIVDVVHREIDVYTEPSGGAYGRKATYRDGEVVTATLVPELAIAVADIPR